MVQPLLLEPLARLLAQPLESCLQFCIVNSNCTSVGVVCLTDLNLFPLPNILIFIAVILGF